MENEPKKTESELVEVLRQIVPLTKELLAKQDKLCADFEAFKASAAKALGEAGLLLTKHATALANHTVAINSHGAALETLWSAAGLPTKEAPKPAVNWCGCFRGPDRFPSAGFMMQRNQA